MRRSEIIARELHAVEVDEGRLHRRPFDALPTALQGRFLAAARRVEAVLGSTPVCSHTTSTLHLGQAAQVVKRLPDLQVQHVSVLDGLETHGKQEREDGQRCGFVNSMGETTGGDRWKKQCALTAGHSGPHEPRRETLP